MTIHLITDDSIDGFFEQEAKARKAADARVTPEQVVQPGEFCICGEEGLRVYSAILDAAAELLGDREPAALDEEEHSEYLFLKEAYADEGMQFYRFTRSFSRGCRNGELGDRHLSTVLRKITKTEFEAARDAGWP